MTNRNLKARILTRFPGPVGATGAQGPVAGEVWFTTRAAVALATISATPVYLRTSGYATAGDGGGALYKRVVSQPTHAGKVQSLDGAWWEYVYEGRTNVRQFGARGDGTTNDTTACQNAINFHEFGFNGVLGGRVHFPSGYYNVPGGLTVTATFAAIFISGDGMITTFLQSKADVVVLTVAGTQCSVEHLTIYGKGHNNDTGTFGASAAALSWSGNSGSMSHVQILGGSPPFLATGSDNTFFCVFSGVGYDTSNYLTTGANILIRCSLDHSATGIAIANSRPFSARANTTVYTVGQVVSLNGHYIQCKTGGISGGSPPALKNVAIDITDGTVTWLWAGAVALAGARILGGAETHIVSSDLSGDIYEDSLIHNATGTYTYVTDTDCSRNVSVSGTGWFHLNNSPLGGDISINGFTGKTKIDGCDSTGAVNILVGANTNDFSIVNNDLHGGTITVQAGTSSHYVITGNRDAVIVDSGTGTHKDVKGGKASETINASYNLATASGTQDITGFGFNPRSCVLNFGINAGKFRGVGYASKSGTQGSSQSTTDDAASMVQVTGSAILVANAAVTAAQTGVVSFITDGIRITWTKLGSPTGTLLITAQGSL